MIKQEQCKIDGEPLYFCQVETIEEAKKLNLPEYCYNYWEKDGKKIYNPLEIVSIIKDGVQNIKSNIDFISSEKGIQNLHNAVVKRNKELLIQGITRMKSEYEKAGYQKSVIDKFNDFLTFYSDL